MSPREALIFNRNIRRKGLSIMEITKQLILKVPRKSIYRFLSGNDLYARISELVPEINVRTPAASHDPKKVGGDVDIIISRIEKMARANPWAGKECKDIITSLRGISEGSWGELPASGEFMKLKSSGTRVLEEIPESRLVIEAWAGLPGVRCEFDLVEQGETTEINLTVRAAEASSVGANEVLLALARDLVSFEQGYQARLRVEYLGRT